MLPTYDFFSGKSREELISQISSIYGLKPAPLSPQEQIIIPSERIPDAGPEGQSVDTIATPAVLAVFNWSKGNDRYRRIEDSSKAFSPSGTSFASPRAIQSGATSILPRPFPAGPAGVLQRRYSGNQRRRMSALGPEEPEEMSLNGPGTVYRDRLARSSWAGTHSKF
jgi:hypothetical protein